MIDGALISWPGATAFKLEDVTKFHMSTPFGLFPAFVVMNTNSYNRLPAKVKAAIDKYSGEAFSHRFGVGLDASNDKTIADFKKMKGHEVVELSRCRARPLGQDAGADHRGMGEAHPRRRPRAQRIPGGNQEDPPGFVMAVPARGPARVDKTARDKA